MIVFGAVITLAVADQIFTSKWADEQLEAYERKGLRDGADLDTATLKELYRWYGYVASAEKWGCEEPSVPWGFFTYMRGVGEGIETAHSALYAVNRYHWEDAGAAQAVDCVRDVSGLEPFLEERTSFFKEASGPDNKALGPNEPDYYQRGYNDGRDLDAGTVARIVQWHGYIENYELSGCVDDTGFELPRGYGRYIAGVYDGLDEKWSASLMSDRDKLWDSSMMVGDTLARGCAWELSSWEPKMRSYGTTFFD